MIGSKEILGGPSAFSSSTINILAPLSVHNKCAFTFISHSTWNSAPDPISRSLFQRQNIKISLWQKRRLLSDMRVAPKKKRRVASSEYYSDPSSASERRERLLIHKKRRAALGLNGWLGEAGVFASACVIITSPPCSNPLFYSLAHAFPVAGSKMVRNIVNARCCPQDTQRRADDGAARRSRSFPSKNTCSRFSERLFPSLAR
jgi:hypothetical protein